ncbi:MFS transporter [Ornithinibacillus contaminans]|uniref:MFS transporter n=1 Tax=Ornithinibacillus contaminans TaxID=694055 RepID=UPI00064DB8BF|nr:MFS transporter [Ornithinibacillus contaminans]
MRESAATSWRYPSLLLLIIGISSVGEWIYFIALNLIVLDMTGSPIAVTGLYIVKPLATLVTNFWAGSIIDRSNKRKLMILLNLARAICIALLPFMASIPLIYLAVLLINMASSMFDPTSMTYTTKLIPIETRKRFNAFHSLINSGAFLIGPAVAGVLFLIGTPTISIYTNAVALLLAGAIMVFMPDLENQGPVSIPSSKFSIRDMKRDWRLVLIFSRKHRYIVTIYFLFSFVMVIMASAVDSLEAVFAKQVLSLTNSEYGFLVAIAGAGILAGAIVNALFIHKMRISFLIGMGTLLVSIGYSIYAFSHSFIGAGIGFFVLAFFTAFANTGFLTFYQNNIPTNIMGRIGSIYGFIEAIFIIVATSILGAATNFISVKGAVILGVFIMIIFSIILLIVSFSPAQKKIFRDQR